MIQEEQFTDSVEPITDTTTVLMVDIGERLTTALLIKKVAGFYRLIGRAMAKTTHSAPHNSVADGVLESIQMLEGFGNQKILNNDKDLVMHTRQPGRGIDQFLISISMERIMNTVVIAPTIEDPAVESAVHLLQRFPSKLKKLFTGANTHDLPKTVTWMAENRPDLVLIVGSDPRGWGMGEKIIQATKALGAGIRQFSESNQPEVIYAASGHWDEEIKEMLNLGTRLKTAPNLRPDARHERVKPVRKLIENYVRENHLAQIPGLAEIIRWSGENPYSRNEGLAIFARFQAALVNGPILILDLDVNGLTMAYAKPRFTDLIIRPDLGLGENLSEAAQTLDLNELSNWVSGSAESAEMLHAHFINRSIFPNSVPQTKHELDLDLAMIQGVIRQGIRDACSAWGLEEDLPLSVDRLFVRGKILEMVGDSDELVLTLFNALQLQGECETFIDPHNAIALLGQLLEQDPDIAVDVIEADAFVSLGWLVGIPGRGRAGRNVISAELYQAGSSQAILKKDIVRGQLTSIALPNEGSIDVTLRYRKIGFANTSKLKGVEGVKARIWIDSRGRPSVLPDDDIDEWEHING